MLQVKQLKKTTNFIIISIKLKTTIMDYKVTTQKTNDIKGMYKVSVFDTNLWEETKNFYTNDTHLIDEIDGLNEDGRIDEIIYSLLKN